MSALQDKERTSSGEGWFDNCYDRIYIKTNIVNGSGSSVRGWKEEWGSGPWWYAGDVDAYSNKQNRKTFCEDNYDILHNF